MGSRSEVEKLLTEALDKAAECTMPDEYHKIRKALEYFQTMTIIVEAHDRKNSRDKTCQD